MGVEKKDIKSLEQRKADLNNSFFCDAGTLNIHLELSLATKPLAVS